MEKKFYTIQQVADLLGFSHISIRKFIKSGKLKAKKIGTKYRVAETDLQAFIDSKE